MFSSRAILIERAANETPATSPSKAFYGYVQIVHEYSYIMRCLSERTAAEAIGDGGGNLRTNCADVRANLCNVANV